MKKIIFSVALLLGACCVFNSCSDDDDDVVLKEENNNSDNTGGGDNNDDNTGNKPSNLTANGTAKLQKEAAKKNDDGTYTASYGNIDMQYKVDNGSATLLNVKSNGATSKAGTDEFTFPDAVWIGEEYIRIEDIGDGTASVFDGKIAGNYAKVVVPENIKGIESDAFGGLGSLETVELPKTIENVSLEAFEGVECDFKIRSKNLEKEFSDSILQPLMNNNKNISVVHEVTGVFEVKAEYNTELIVDDAEKGSVIVKTSVIDVASGQGTSYTINKMYVSNADGEIIGWGGDQADSTTFEIVSIKPGTASMLIMYTIQGYLFVEEEINFTVKAGSTMKSKALCSLVVGDTEVTTSQNAFVKVNEVAKLVLKVKNSETGEYYNNGTDYIYWLYVGAGTPDVLKQDENNQYTVTCELEGGFAIYADVTFSDNSQATGILFMVEAKE